MAISPENKVKIIQLIEDEFSKKLQNYREDKQSRKPFQERLFSEEHLKIVHIVHSIITTFGTTVFEPIAEIVAEDRFKVVEKQKLIGTTISQDAHNTVNRLINELITNRREVDIYYEIEEIRKVSNANNQVEITPSLVDIYVEDHENNIYLFEFKTPKPNKDQYQKIKNNILQWIALVFNNNSNAKVNTYVGIPYNPSLDKQYNFWTSKNMIDKDNELMVGKELWDFLGGDGTYEDLLRCFESTNTEKIFNNFLKN